MFYSLSRSRAFAITSFIFQVGFDKIIFKRVHAVYRL